VKSHPEADISTVRSLLLRLFLEKQTPWPSPILFISSFSFLSPTRFFYVRTLASCFYRVLFFPGIQAKVMNLFFLLSLRLALSFISLPTHVHSRALPLLHRSASWRRRSLPFYPSLLSFPPPHLLPLLLQYHSPRSWRGEMKSVCLL